MFIVKQVIVGIGLITFISLPGAYSEIDDDEWKMADVCTTPDDQEGRCVQLFSCSSLLDLFTNPPEERLSYVNGFKCGERYGTILVCCPKFYSYDYNFVSKRLRLSDKSFCGFQNTESRFSSLDKNRTELDEFPWVAAVMALLNNEDEIVYCHGALINERYVLTSAGCAVTIDVELGDWVRLGEYHLKNKTDCVERTLGPDCNESEDFGIEEILIHPFYNYNDFVYPGINDIALLRLNKSVSYTDYIRPICLPVRSSAFPRAGGVVYSTGWGKPTFSSNDTIVKRKATIRLTNNSECLNFLGSHFPADANITALRASYAVTRYFVCGFGKAAYCSNTNGEPLMFSYKFQWYLGGISSWDAPCNIKLPVRYTKVSKYMHWIRDSIDCLNRKYPKKEVTLTNSL